MASTKNTLQYLKVDYQSHKDALLQRVRARWPNAWNDFLSNSFGIVIVDIIAWSMSTLAFVMNRLAGENFITTMTLRESAVRLGSLTGYQLRNPVPATVSCEATLSSTLSAAVLISKGSIIRTSDTQALAFEVSQDYTIAAGDLTPSTPVITLSPELSGASVINTFVVLTAGSANVDCVDTTTDLSQYVEVGQTFNKIGDATVYTIQGLETVPGAISNFTRLVLDRNYEGTTETAAAEVTDARISLTQGQSAVDRFVSPASANPNFIVKLSRTSVIDHSLTVTVNGDIWDQVPAAALRGADDNVYQTKTFVAGQTVVIFGDGRFGSIIPTEAAIIVSYRTGGGANGNIALNSINTSITGLITSLSNPVPVTITNSTSTGSGGRDAETLEEARINIPSYARTNDRAVTLEDYQTLAQQFTDPQYGSVAYARTAVRSENSFFEGNIVVVYAWTVGSDSTLVPLSNQLKSALQDYLQSKSIGTDLVAIYDGTARPVPVSLRFRAFSGFSVADTVQIVKDTLKSFITALRPGDTVTYSNLLRSLDEAYGVDTVNMATPIADLTPSNSTELFTPPQDSYVYSIARVSFGSPVIDSNGSAISNYTASLPIFPLQAWAFRLFLGSSELTVVPHALPGYARLFGDNVSSDDAYPSTVNLLTGGVSIWLKGAPGDFTMKLVAVQGYAAEKSVNVYIGYAGDVTIAKRREIRAALRTWSDGQAIGGSIYARRVSGVFASRVSVTDVVEAVSGVDNVTRVALDTPSSTLDRVAASTTELIRLANITINNFVD